MRTWSFSLGRLFGVELRIHWLFAALLFVSYMYASGAGMGGWRGTVLWLLLLGAVAVRETARAIAAAFRHIELRSILLLPVGGLQSPLEMEETTPPPAVAVALSLVGPLANVLAAGLLAGLLAGGSPGVLLAAHPLVSPAHLLRSAVWLNLGLALIHLVPAFPLDAGRLLRELSVKKHGPEEASRAAVSLGRMLGSFATALGIGLLFAFPEVPLAEAAAPWLLLGGFFTAIGAQLDDQGISFQSVVDTVFMRDIMLRNFTFLSPSDTLHDALGRIVHSLQDDFPVVRSGEIVGVVSRGLLLASMRIEGNNYVQSLMNRAFLIASPDDTLGKTMRRMRLGRVGMIPVADEEGCVLGLVTLQNMRQSMPPLLEQRRASILRKL